MLLLCQRNMGRLPDTDNLGGGPLPDLRLVDVCLSGHRGVALFSINILALVVLEAVDLVGDVSVGLSEDVLGLDGGNVADVPYS